MEKLSDVRPALGQTRTHGGGRQNSQTESKKEGERDFSANSLTKQLFHSNLGLQSPKQRRVSVESQTNSSVRLRSSKPSKAEAQWSRCLQVASTQRLKKNVTKATNSEANGKHHQQQALSVIYCCVFFFFHLHVSLKRKLVRRARPAQLLKIPL